MASTGRSTPRAVRFLEEAERAESGRWRRADMRRRLLLAELLAPPVALRRGGHRDLRALSASRDA